MGKIVLEFDNFEESEDARDALNGTKWRLAMWNLDQKLRETTKYGVSMLHKTNEATPAEVEIAEKIRDVIREILDEQGLNLE
jgi:hypothetical protein